jgi:hypothetical protein
MLREGHNGAECLLVVMVCLDEAAATALLDVVTGWCNVCLATRGMGLCLQSGCRLHCCKNVWHTGTAGQKVDAEKVNWKLEVCVLGRDGLSREARREEEVMCNVHQI